MKKQSLITLVTALFAVLTLTTFYACSADEGAPEAAQPTTKADILRAKAKEFAKKYGVNMTLNEDKIDSLAQVLTVEQMEEDFKALSTAKFEIRSSQPSNLVRKGLRIRANKSFDEERDETYSGTARFTTAFVVVYKTNDKEGNITTSSERVSVYGDVSWTFGLTVANTVTITLRSEDSKISGSSRPIPNLNGGDYKEGTFSASGPMSIQYDSYIMQKSVSVKCMNKSVTSIDIK